jgi:transglutaminase-like putative cysteine protease
MLYTVTHTTRYQYAAPVSHCLSEVRLTPRALASQSVRSSEIRVEPAPAFFHNRQDYFGNAVSVFSVLEKHAQLTATAHSVVEVSAPPLTDAPVMPWESAGSAVAAPADPDSMTASEFVFQSPYVPVFEGLAAYARETFLPGRPMFEAVRELMKRIHGDFLYDSKATSIDTPLPDVFRNRKGVCQDFAHVMIGVLRSVRLSARYVSGYVRSGGQFQGAQASHAWVSVYFPGTGWLDFDPTNNVMPSEGHVTVAWGRDYGDVTPIKGVSLGGGGQTVEVEVYVKPIGNNGG